MERVFGGADLMLPGIIGVRRKGEGKEGVKKGEIVGIVDYERDNVVLAVGVAETDISAAGGRGEKGRGVRVLHWVGDELWGLGGNGINPPERLEAKWVSGTDVSGEDGGVSLDALKIDGVEEDAGESSSAAAARGAAPAEEDDDDEPQFPEMTTQEIDAAFRSALVYAFYEVYNSPDRNPNAHKAMEFPLASSYVLATLIIPKLPNASNPQYSIQKTSWKKIQKMLKAMDKENLLKIKDRGGDVVVYAVNWDCDKIRDFQPYPIIKPKPKKKKAEEGAASSSANGASGGTAKVVELYKPSAKLGVIYDITDTSMKEFYTASQVKETLYKYFTSPAPSDPSETLVSSTNARNITLNPIIANLLLDQSIPTDLRLLQARQATRDFLADRFIRLHNPYWSIVTPSGEETKPKAGTPPKITITIESRQGKKTVTKIKGMEVFGVDVGGFLEELKSVAASSVTTGKVEGGGKAAEGMVEVLVQGDKVSVVEGLLTKSGIRKVDITVDNKLKKGKK
ncbi:Ligatin [Dactylella cylindrospora]|nr:Ligatin [Dactylella cylindrospora]